MINIVYSIIPVICFIAGFSFGFKVGIKKEIPKIQTPTEYIEHKKEVKKQRQEKTELAQYMDNIENYPYNQKDF